MAPVADLRVKGSEAFGLISSRRRSNMKNGVFPARQGRWVVQVPNDELEDPVTVINAIEASARYGGIMIVNYSKPQTRLTRPFKP